MIVDEEIGLRTNKIIIKPKKNSKIMQAIKLILKNCKPLKIESIILILILICIFLYIKITKTTEIISSPFYSVIVPIYNGQNYLHTLINHIKNQNFNEYEIILVDDKSTDNSTKIIKNEIKKDKRIVLIENKENRGILYSRREGFKNSKGKYILFMDQDDLLINNILKEAYKLCKTNYYDIIDFDFGQGPKNKIKYTIKKNNNKNITQPELTKYRFLNQQFSYLWGRIFKSEILNKTYKNINESFFNEHICYHEDTIIADNIFGMANTYTTLNVVGILHIYNDKSLSDKISDNFSNKSIKKLLHDSILASKALISLSQYNENIKWVNEQVNSVLLSVAFNSLNYYKTSKVESDKEIRKIKNNIKSNPIDFNINNNSENLNKLIYIYNLIKK